MNFLTPVRLLLVIPVVALAIGYVAMQARRTRYAVRFTNLDLLDSVAPRRPGWRRHVAAALAGLSAVALVVGLARPTVQTRVPTENAVVVLAIDTSISMEATDVSPSRMDAAITEAMAFVDELPDEFEVGLVSFNGTAQVLAAPTTDHASVIAAIDGLTTARGTAGGDAIEAALSSITVALDDTNIESIVSPDSVSPDAASDTLESVADAPAATVVMLSDGTTTAGTDILDAAALAAEQSIPVSTITYGTAAGTVVVDGQTASVPPDTEAMAAVADVTGGIAFQAASADELAEVYAQIEARVGSTIEQRDISMAFVAGAFVMLLLAAGAAFVWTGRFL